MSIATDRPDTSSRPSDEVPGRGPTVPPAVALATQARYRSRERIAVGDLAPDFNLERLGAETPRAERVRLSSFRGQRPVALFFGSYT
jgi:hypothetical protein